MPSKIGFWSVLELVTISQIGSGLMLPATLAPYGTLSLFGWLVSSLGAILLAIVFSKLCTWFPRTGGPHVYVKEAFGASAAFFTGWTYWVISWVSTIAIIISAVGYLTPLFGSQSAKFNLFLELTILFLITAFNFRGITTAGNSKFIVAFKLIPLLLIPIAALFFFDKNNFVAFSTASHEISSNFNNVILLTMWGFIGFESATACVGEINEPTKTIPRALILGTLLVSIIYFISSLGIMGIIPGHVLMNSNAPYTDTISVLLGGNWHLLVTFLAAIICIGAVNAWTLASGQIALGITEDGLMPRFFAIKNKHGAPIMALLISCLGTIPLLCMTQHESLVQNVNTVIDFSVTSFLFIYIISTLAFLKLLWRKREPAHVGYWLCGLISLSFCGWVLSATPLRTLLLSSLFVLSGLPIYLLRRRKLKANPLEDMFPSVSTS